MAKTGPHGDRIGNIPRFLDDDHIHIAFDCMYLFEQVRAYPTAIAVFEHNYRSNEGFLENLIQPVN